MFKDFLSRLIIPATSNTIILGPSVLIASDKEPAPSFFRFVTLNILPP